MLMLCLVDIGLCVRVCSGYLLEIRIAPKPETCAQIKLAFELNRSPHRLNSFGVLIQNIVTTCMT